MLKYENIRLREIKISDTQLMLKWRNSKAVKINLFSQEELTEQQHLWWLENKVATGECLQYIIELVEPCLPIGTVFIKNIDTANNKGEFGIFIGDDFARGKGYGTIATRLILKHSFEVLKLNRVYLSVLDNNKSAVRSYEKVGFKKEGLLRQDYIREGMKYDVVIMGITADMYTTFPSY